MNNNPLLNVFNTPYQTPPFSSIKEEHYLPAFTKAMELGKQELKNLLSSTDEPTFSSTIEALENMGVITSYSIHYTKLYECLVWRVKYV